LKLDYEVSIAELIEFNPHKVMATFILADDKPNDNNQGIPFSEFEKIAKSAIGMPVKMRFTGMGVANHEGSIPIGSIQEVEINTVSDDYHQLIAKAALWVGEYPEEVKWLRQAFANGKAPGISYEMNYKAYDEVDNIQWIKDTFTGAATFVKTPAYGARTALIALASTAYESELERDIIALAEQLITKNNSKGGNRMDEKELEALKAERDTFKADAATKQSEIEALTGTLGEKDKELEALRTENEGLKKSALVDARLRQYTEAGFSLEAEAEKAEKRKNRFATLSDEEWADYLADLVALKPVAPAQSGGVASASLKTPAMPKPEVPITTDIQTLRQGLRGLSRPNQID
jgi:hypothetical protein